MIINKWNKSQSKVDSDNNPNGYLQCTLRESKGARERRREKREERVKKDVDTTTARSRSIDKQFTFVFPIWLHFHFSHLRVKIFFFFLFYVKYLKFGLYWNETVWRTENICANAFANIYTLLTFFLTCAQNFEHFTSNFNLNIVTL